MENSLTKMIKGFKTGLNDPESVKSLITSLKLVAKALERYPAETPETQHITSELVVLVLGLIVYIVTEKGIHVIGKSGLDGLKGIHSLIHQGKIKEASNVLKEVITATNIELDRTIREAH